MDSKSVETLPSVVARWANADPSRTFLIEVGGDRQTYAETHSKALDYAASFETLGVRSGDRVATLLGTSNDAVNVWLGLSWINATMVPINTAFIGEMLRYVLASARAEVLVCNEKYLEGVLSVAGAAPNIKNIIVIDTSSPSTGLSSDQSKMMSREEFVGLGHGAASDRVGPQIHDDAIMMFTSGTTGRSKAVPLPWGAFVQAAANLQPPSAPFSQNDVLYLPYPMFHTSGTQWFAAAAGAGASIVLRDGFSTKDFWKEIRSHSCTVVMLLGAMAGFIARQDRSHEDEDNTLRAVAIVPMIQDVEEFQARFGVQVYTVYGSTEMGIMFGSDLLERVRSPSIGVLRPGYEVRIVDGFDKEVADGEVGELVVRPNEPWTTFAGYFDMSDATASAFRNLWFHTGDAMRRTGNGEYLFVDRYKDSIRRRGENISSMEVESFVLQYEPVLECAAVAVPSEYTEDEIKISVVPKPGCRIDPEALTNFLVSQDVPGFMIPKYVEVSDSLPKTPTGKVRKDLIRSGGVSPRTWTRPSPRP